MRNGTSQKITLPVRSDVITSPDLLTSTPYEDLVSRMTPDSSNRNRMQFRWAFDLRKRCEFELAFWLEDKKLTRQFTTIVRNAVRLYHDLEQGEYTVLRELFPDVVRKIVQDARPASEEFNRLLAEIADLKRQAMTTPIGQGALKPGAR